MEKSKNERAFARGMGSELFAVNRINGFVGFNITGHTLLYTRCG
jgi:hypothetical protein